MRVFPIKMLGYCHRPGDPTYQFRTKLYQPSDLNVDLENTNPGYFKSISHHPIKNTFHSMEFGINANNIHLATPGECLHMHQLGIERRAVEAFSYLLRGLVTDEFGQTAKKQVNVGSSLQQIEELAHQFGGFLSRQSNRNLPCTKFGSPILSTTKKEGHEIAGLMLNILLAMLSDRGREILFIERTIVRKRIEDQVYAFELILAMEEWLKGGYHTCRKIKNLPRAINLFMKIINTSCQRDGMGTKLIKNHLLFHIPKYMNLWGPPKGWDSGPSESHHKTEVKAPSQKIQRRPTSLIAQTSNRYYELILLKN